MKVLCVIDSLGSGGAQRQMVGLAKGFNAVGHEVSFLVYHDEPFFEKELLDSSIHVYKILERRYFLRVLKIRQFIRRGNFDSILSFLEVPSLICEISMLPCKKWLLIVGERNADPAILNSFRSRLFRYFHFLADFVVGNSNENIKLIKRVNPLLSKKKLKVIYNQIDISKWQSNSKPSNSALFNLTIVARHEYQKNLIGLIKAVSLLTDDEKKRLIINWYGGTRTDKSKDEGLEKISQLSLQRIFNFWPETSDIKSKMEEAHAIGLFSHYEGLPNCICEAMILGKPVVVSNVSDLPFFLNDRNLISNASDPVSIKNSLSYMLSLTNEQLFKIGDLNRITAIKLFNSNEAVNSYLKLMSDRGR